MAFTDRWVPVVQGWIKISTEPEWSFKNISKLVLPYFLAPYFPGTAPCDFSTKPQRTKSKDEKRTSLLVARSRRILLRGDLLRKTDRCQVGQVVAAVLNIVRGVLNIIKVVTAALNIVKRASKEMRGCWLWKNGLPPPTCWYHLYYDFVREDGIWAAIFYSRLFDMGWWPHQWWVS